MSLLTTIAPQADDDSPFLKRVIPNNGSKIVNDEIREYFDLIVGYWVVLVLSSVGVVTNGLTMAVFARQGFKDSINVSLFSIALWDELKCLTAFVYRMYGPLRLINPVWGVNWRNILWSYGIYLPIISGNVSYGLATYVSIERCLSVSMPFKVKSIFTPRLTTCVMVAVSAVLFISFSPMLFVYKVVYTFDSTYNTSVAKLTPSQLYSANDSLVLKVYKVMGITYPAIFCAIMTTSSAIIVYHLRRSAAKFQIQQTQENSNLPKDKRRKMSSVALNPREVRVTRMLLVIIFVYLGDFFPRLSKYTASLIEPDFFVYKRYHNLMFVCSNIAWFLDFINASVNFFVFIRMSTNFKATFSEMFPIFGLKKCRVRLSSRCFVVK